MGWGERGSLRGRYTGRYNNGVDVDGSTAWLRHLRLSVPGGVRLERVRYSTQGHEHNAYLRGQYEVVLLLTLNARLLAPAVLRNSQNHRTGWTGDGMCLVAADLHNVG